MSKNDEYISDFSAAPNTENQLRIIKEVLESDLRKEDKEKILSGFAKQIREDQADINEAFRDSTRERMQQLTQGIQGIIDANPDFTSTLNELSQVAAPQQRVGKKSEADELEAFFADDDQQAEVASRSVGKKQKLEATPPPLSAPQVNNGLGAYYQSSPDDGLGRVAAAEPVVDLDVVDKHLKLFNDKSEASVGLYKAKIVLQVINAQDIEPIDRKTILEQFAASVREDMASQNPEVAAQMKIFADHIAASDVIASKAKANGVGEEFQALITVANQPQENQYISKFNDLQLNGTDRAGIIKELLADGSIDPAGKKEILQGFKDRAGEFVAAIKETGVGQDDPLIIGMKKFTKDVQGLIGQNPEFQNELEGLVAAAKPLEEHRVEEAAATPPTPSRARADSDELAEDSFLVGSSGGSSRGAGNYTDPITEAIRREILEKQREALREHLGQTEPRALVKEKFKQYLEEPENKQKIDEALDNPALKTRLEAIEVAGYKAVHSDSRFKKLEWGQPDGATQTRSKEVLNDAGQKLCQLTETTQTKDGMTYRTVNFPMKLDVASGPMHVSLAVKDKNGRNIAAKDAVYFTAHYDRNGQLEEVSSPIPVKFASDSTDAIGYIERNGERYTLPVTKGTYTKMMEQIKEKGQSVNLSRVDERTLDEVSVAVAPPTARVERERAAEDLDKLKRGEEERVVSLTPITPPPQAGLGAAKKPNAQIRREFVDAALDVTSKVVDLVASAGLPKQKAADMRANLGASNHPNYGSTYPATPHTPSPLTPHKPSTSRGGGRGGVG